MVATCNRPAAAARGAVSQRVDLATMGSQQAVAKHLLEGASPLGRAFFLWPGRRQPAGAEAAVQPAVSCAAATTAF